MKILITGADGFIGSHLTETLVRLGYDIRAFVIYNSNNSWGWLDESENQIKDAIDIFAGDIRDSNGVRTAMKGCDAVIHLAALIAIPYSYHSPSTYVETNINGTLNVLQAAKDCGVSRVLHTSTSEVYGSALTVPITEDHPIRGQSPYSATKIAADQLAYSFFTSFDLPVVTVRPFNTYGPRQSARAVIPTVISQIINGQSEIKLGSTTPTRDFNFIEDTVSAFISILESERGCGEVFNIGSNFEISIEATVALIAKIMNSDIRIQTDETRLRPAKSEVDRLFSCNQKAKATFGWSPKYAGYVGLEQGLAKTIEWLRRPENIKRYKSNIYNL